MEVDEMETRIPDLQESDKRVENQTKRDEERDDEENMSDFPSKSVPSTNETPSKETQLKDGSDLLHVKSAVVVLTRLPDYKISALRPPTPLQFYSEDDSLSSSDSDMQWEPEDDSCDSEFSLSQKKKKTGKHTTAAHTSRINNNNNLNGSESAPVIISSAFAHCSNETTKSRPDLPEVEINVDMVVLARRRSMKWHRGKIIGTVTKEDGRMKYKISFEEKGKSLVSGHHIAFDTTPRLEQLFVGARVVVRCPENKFLFRPGVLAELPSRKNRLRFLVFLDSHRPVYVGLPLFHLVCRPPQVTASIRVSCFSHCRSELINNCDYGRVICPWMHADLENVLDDVPDSSHKAFMTQYLKDWPYPHLTQYRAGQSLNVLLFGSHQRCMVQMLDSSLMHVIFQDHPRKEWIHRGSMRLEHMARFLEMKRAEEHNDDSD